MRNTPVFLRRSEAPDGLEGCRLPENEATGTGSADGCWSLTRTGTRVLVVAETRGSNYFGMNYHTLVVDGFAVQ